MGRPIIGITGELEAARWGNWIREAVVSPVSYTRAVERAGGTPVILPPVPATSVPVLIAGAGAVEMASAGMGGQGQLLLLAAMLVVAAAFAPWAIAAALRISAE